MCKRLFVCLCLVIIPLRAVTYEIRPGVHIIEVVLFVRQKSSYPCDPRHNTWDLLLETFLP